jgi:hypothetical protein
VAGLIGLAWFVSPPAAVLLGCLTVVAAADVRRGWERDGNNPRFRVVSFRMADVMAGSWRKNGEAMIRLAPRGKANAMRPRLSEREQAPALHSGTNPQSPAHFGVRRLATALSPRELAATSERRSLPDCALSPPEWLMAGIGKSFRAVP